MMHVHVNAGNVFRHVKAYVQLLGAVAYGYWSHRRWATMPDLACIDLVIAASGAVLFLRFVRYQLAAFPRRRRPGIPVNYAPQRYDDDDDDAGAFPAYERRNSEWLKGVTAELEQLAAHRRAVADSRHGEAT